MRKDAREAVFKILYSEMYSGEFDAELFDELCKEANLKPDEKDFAVKLLDTVKDNYSYLTGVIGELAENYALDRVYPTDKCTLLIGLCEMKFFDDVPNIVAIDEALSLCRKYSTENSLGFVNGIFAKYKTMIENG